MQILNSSLWQQLTSRAQQLALHCKDSLVEVWFSLVVELIQKHMLCLPVGSEAHMFLYSQHLAQHQAPSVHSAHTD